MTRVLFDRWFEGRLLFDLDDDDGPGGAPRAAVYLVPQGARTDDALVRDRYLAHVELAPAPRADGADWFDWRPRGDAAALFEALPAWLHADLTACVRDALPALRRAAAERHEARARQEQARREAVAKILRAQADEMEHAPGAAGSATIRLAAEHLRSTAACVTRGEGQP